MKQALLLIFIFSAAIRLSANPANDGDWKSRNVVLKNTPQADVMIRLGDIDNLGFGWASGFDPFSGMSTEIHSFPWKVAKDETPGMDRILLPSSYDTKMVPCGNDGYAGSYNPKTTKPVPFIIDLKPLKGITVSSAIIQVFIDDFQSPGICSRFTVTVNGKRFEEFETLLSLINQTGPIGKVLTLAIPHYLLNEFKSDKVSILIDDMVSGSGDGFAVDFVKVLINPKNFGYYGVIRGNVLSEDWTPLPGAKIYIPDVGAVTADATGYFELRNVFAGLNVLYGSAEGHITGKMNIDVIANNNEPDGFNFVLKKERDVIYQGKKLNEGDTLTISAIQFPVASSLLNDNGKTELMAIKEFMIMNPEVVIELSGHTSSEGDEKKNWALSRERENVCRDYLIMYGIEPHRIIAIGYGSTKPKADNTSETGRVQNRRVEMKILKVVNSY